MEIKKFIEENKIEITIILSLFIFATLARIYFMNHCLWVDEARDLSVTRNLLTGEGLKNHNLKPMTKHPPFYYLMLGASSLISGSLFLGSQGLIVILGALTSIFVYLLGKEIVNKKVGLIAGFLMAIHPLHWFYSVRILNHVPATFFAIGSIFFFHRWFKNKSKRDIYISTILLGLGIATRISVGAILLGYIIFLVYKNKGFTFFKKKEILISAIILIAILSPIAIRLYLITGSPLPPVITKQGLTGKEILGAGPPTYYITNFLQIMRIPIGILFLIGVPISFLFKSKRIEMKYLLILLAIMLVFFSLWRVKVARYILSTVPLVITFASIGLYKLSKDILKNKKLIYLAIVIVLFITSFMLISEATMLIPTKASSFCGLEEIGSWIKHNGIEGSKVAAGSRTIISYYSNRKIEKIPDNKTTLVNNLEEGKIKYLEVDRWERTQPNYISQFVHNNSKLTPVKASEVNGSVVSVVYRYEGE